MSTDAFAAASEAASKDSGNTGSRQSVNATSIPVGAMKDVDNPFAKSSELKGSGGEWTPRVPFEDIEGRLVVMIPKSFDPEARDPFKEGATREEFRVDLVILDGGKLEYEYTEKDPNDLNNRIYKTMTVEEFPFTAKSQNIGQGGLIGKLKEVHKDGRFWLGVMSYAPYARDRKNGATIDSTKKKVEEWIARARKGTKPEYTWTLDDREHVLTPEREALAAAWWQEYRKTL